MSARNHKYVSASHRVEELSIMLKNLVTELRDHPDRNVYARLYYVRYRLDQVVARLGVGVPSGLTEAGDYCERLVSDDPRSTATARG